MSGTLFAESEAQVARVIKSANRWSIAIDPLSTGFNFGYGDAFPETGKQVCLDLRRMNRITELNREERWLRIQPGVSQRQLADYLEAHAPELSFDQTSWLPESSVIGNSLERGRTLFSERERDLIGARLILGSGKALNTGFNPEEKSPLQSGLNLHPLIFQSGLGVVVEGIVRLQHAKKKSRYFLIGCATPTKLFDTLDILNRTPYEEARPLRWFCRSSFGQTPAAGEKVLRDCSGGVLVIETLLKKYGSVHLPGIVRSVRRNELTTAPTLSRLKAMLGETSMSFFSFSVRRSRRAMKDAQKLVEAVGRKYPVKIYQTISFLEDGAIYLLRAEVSAGETANTLKKIFFGISKDIEAAGYQMYRSHSGIPLKPTTDHGLKSELKKCFDPQGIISPGRYGF